MNKKEIKEIFDTYDEYVELLGGYCNSSAIFMFTHGVITPQKDIDKGKELRDKIDKLKKEFI